MTHRRTYKSAGVDVPRLVHALVAWYQAGGYAPRVVEPAENRRVIRVRQAEVWRSVLGISSTLNVTLSAAEDTLAVDIRFGRWVDRALAGTMGLFLLWALFFTAAYRMWLQAHVPDHTFAFIEHFIATGEPYEQDKRRFFPPSMVSRGTAQRLDKNKNKSFRVDVESERGMP